MTLVISFAVVLFLLTILYRNRNAMGWRQCIEIYAGKGNFEPFCKWAFGPKYESILMEDVPKWWNLIHGEKLKLEPNGRIIDDVRKMIVLWKSEVEKISPNP